MKKLMFLVMLFGLMIIGTDSASAQGACKTAEPAAEEVFLYTDINFGGTCVSLKKFGRQSPNMANLPTIPNDSISSVKVGKNARALVCRDFDFKGDCTSLFGNDSNISHTVVGNDQISSIKVLQKRQMVQMTFTNQTGKTVKIYEQVGGVNSFLGTLDPNAGGIIYSDVMTTIVGMVDDRGIGGGFQLKNASAKQINIDYAANGPVQMTLR